MKAASRIIARIKAEESAKRQRPTATTSPSVEVVSAHGTAAPIVRRKPHRLDRPKKTDPTHNALWKIINGAVAMTFHHHPDYISTRRSERIVRLSLVKRIVGVVNAFVQETESRPVGGPRRLSRGAKPDEVGRQVNLCQEGSPLSSGDVERAS